MFYSELVKKAALIAFNAHKDDLDKGGYPYFMHPHALALSLDDEDTVIVALLHDVVEDHGDKYSFQDLKNEGFNDNIINALMLLTKNDDVDYLDYINNIKENDIARRVKLADLRHNLDSSRVDSKAYYKAELYKKAIEILEG